MKLLSSLTLLVATAALAAVAQGDAGYPETGFEPVGLRLRRSLADGSGPGPSPSPSPSPSPTPPPVTPTPTPTPPPVTPTPTPSVGPTPTPAPGTPTPGTPTPGTPTPGSGSGTTPTPTTKAPSSSTEDPTLETVSPNTKTPLSTSGSSGSGNSTKSTKTPTPGSGSSGTTSDSDSDSKLSTGAIVGIVGGIVAGVAILAFVTMTLIRRKRENEDDPLSPFELSMDKGYAGAQGYGGSAAAGAVAGANGAQRNAPGHTQELGLTDTPPAGAVAAGVAYSQFYDQATSPGSLNHTRQASAEHEPAAAADNSTNLWMSAMEAQHENDSYLSAKESRDNDSLNSGGRNSYDVGYADDQSSQISGSSDLNSAKDFPDYDDESARGSYEL